MKLTEAQMMILRAAVADGFFPCAQWYKPSHVLVTLGMAEWRDPITSPPGIVPTDPGRAALEQEGKSNER